MDEYPIHDRHSNGLLLDFEAKRVFRSDLGRDGHFELRRSLDDGIYIGIPIEQYVRIFGD